MDIKWVKQSYHTCGQTCVAMVAGVSLEESLSHFKKTRGTCTKDLHNALIELGFKTPTELVRINNNGLPDLCVVKICWFDKKGKRLNMGHWAVYHDHTFYDPESGPYTVEDYNNLLEMWMGKITSYLPIQKA